MLEHIADFTAWPILTGIAAYDANNKVHTTSLAFTAHDAIGNIANKNAGTFISHLLNIELLGKGYLTNFVFCVVGAVTVLWIWKKLFD